MLHQNDPKEQRKERFRVLVTVLGGLSSIVRLVIEVIRLDR